MGVLDYFRRRKAPRQVRDVAELARALPRPAVQVVLQDTPSRSHFGGGPELPAGVAWPLRAGKPLDFLARISLPELHHACAIDWLPRGGALLFFYDVEQQPWGFDPKDRGGWAVLHVPDLAHPVAAQPIGLRRFECYPRSGEALDALALNDDEHDDYGDLCESAFGDLPRHQISGFPSPVQGDAMALECQLASHGLYCGDASGYHDPRAAALRAGAADWRLLLQFDSDDSLGLMWGDCGTLYFWVREADARAGHFGNAWLVLQCC